LEDVSAGHDGENGKDCGVWGTSALPAIAWRGGLWDARCFAHGVILRPVTGRAAQVLVGDQAGIGAYRVELVHVDSRIVVRRPVRWRRRTSFKQQFIREWTLGALM
jgi:hypothetical protein